MPHMIITLSSEDAAALVREAVAFAAENGWRVAAAAVDAQGVMLAAQRMDGAAPPILDFALDKAFTAATMGKSTEDFATRMASSPSLTMGLANRERLIAWKGGVPVLHEGAVIGGLAVSGARDEDDIACAEAALRAGGFLD